MDAGHGLSMQLHARARVTTLNPPQATKPGCTVHSEAGLQAAGYRMHPLTSTADATTCALQGGKGSRGKDSQITRPCC